MKKIATQTFNHLVERVTEGSDDIKLRFKAKLLLYMILLLVSYSSIGTILKTKMNPTSILVVFLMILSELKLINTKFSGYVLFGLSWAWYTFKPHPNEEYFRYVACLANYPMLVCSFLNNKKIYMMLLFWGTIVIKFFQPYSATLEELQKSHEIGHWTILSTSVCASIFTWLQMKNMEKYSNATQQKNIELQEANKKLQEAKEEAIKSAEKLKQTVSKLETSNKALEQALNAKKSFITKVSDELRNPINSIIGNLELLEDQQANPFTHEKLVSIKWSTDLLLQMTNNIIDASKLQNGTIEINKRSTSTSKMFERLWAMNFQKMRQKALRGLLYLSRDVPRDLVLDEEKALEVCHNILTNSVKYTDAGKIKIIISWIPKLSHPFSHTEVEIEDVFSLRQFCETVRTHVSNSDAFMPLDISKTEEDKIYESCSEAEAITLKKLSQNSEFDDYLRVNRVLTGSFPSKDEFFVLTTEKSVFGNAVASELQTYPTETLNGDLKIEIIDSGCGMDSSIFPELYRSIFQHESQATRDLGGKGLGIYVSTELMRLMGGEIRYFSRKRVGTSVIITIPAEIPEARFSRGSLGQIMPLSLSEFQKVALVVDDEKMNREILSSYLQKLDFTAVHAENGAEAVKIFQQMPEDYFALITMDLQMPVMNGIEACKQIRAVETAQRRQRKAKIVVITANCTEEDKDEVLNPNKACKANSFFRKPLTMADCRNFVQEIRNQKKSSK